MWISWRMRWWSWMWFKQGQSDVECGDESDCSSDECGDKCGDGHAEKTNPAGIPSHTKLTTLFPPNNQSKPIVQSLFPHLL